MTEPLRFEIGAKSRICRARTGLVTTPHGSFETPAFMPVGTKATIKGLLPPQVAATGAQCVLNNTYHLLLRPGEELIQRRGGVHAFMGWDGPILTDSGGYQAYSMADINAIDEDGVTFKSIVTGSPIRLTPERAIEVQNALGADIIMAFDDCPPSVDPAAAPINQTRLREAVHRDTTKGYDHSARLDLALERTTRWLDRCKRAHGRADAQALFGIVQGGTDLERRTESAKQVTAIELPGYAIGGVAVGEQSDDIDRVTAHTAPLLPEDKPRYLMGVGYPRDLVAAVRSGVDMFDCVLPTRNGRNANAFTRLDETGDGRFQIRLRNARFAEDDGPLESDCDCTACDPGGHGWATPGGRPFSRAYIRHLFISEEMLGPILISIHNLRHYQRLMTDLRSAIGSDGWDSFAARWPGASGSVAR
ncbi:MAG: tRNA guanosine(34) transglycosylase Tgt [Planctomycetota bacterium]